MKVQKKQCILRLIKLLNIVLLTIPFGTCWMRYYEGKIYVEYGLFEDWTVIFIFILLYVLFARIYDAFLVSLYRISEMIYSQILAVAISDGFMYLIFFLMMRSLPNLVPGLMALAVQCCLVVLWSVCSHKWYFHVSEPKYSAIIHGSERGMTSLIHEYGMEKKFYVSKSIPVMECIQNLSMLSEFETVFLEDRKSVV